MADHELEGRTAHECFELARIALDQAEQVVNRASSTLECAKAQASASIAIGWARLGDALANEPRELKNETYFCPPTPVRLGQHNKMGTHRFGIGDGTCPACRMTLEQATSASERGDICVPGPWWGGPRPIRLEQLAKAVPPDVPDHVHSPDCAHQWIRPAEPCRACAQLPTEYRLRCPVPCPEPGGWVSAP